MAGHGLPWLAMAGPGWPWPGKAGPWPVQFFVKTAQKCTFLKQPGEAMSIFGQVFGQIVGQDFDGF